MLKNDNYSLIKHLYNDSFLQRIIEETKSLFLKNRMLVDNRQTLNISRTMAFISLLTIVLMTIYETLKGTILPNLTLWQSHIITILFAGFIAPIGAYYALKRIEELRLKAIKELNEKNIIAKELQKAHNTLEQRVKDRTFELKKLNEIMHEEIVLRKKIEEELRSYTEQIFESKTIVEQKNKQLIKLNKQLEESEKELKELIAAKDKFFSILAHDLRSPFNALLGSTEMLEHEAEDLEIDEIKAFAKSINNTSKNFYRLLENLLQWSRMQTGRIQYQPKYFVLESVINEIYFLFIGNAQQKQINLKIPQNFTHEVYADYDMISTIIRNLISNAIKFTNKGGTISILTGYQNEKVFFRISDNGVGIPKQKLAELFSINKNTSTRGTDNEKGTGLGLILCREFIELNKGHLSIESHEDIGSTFTIYLPKNNYLED